MEEAQGIDCLGRHMSINAERLVSEVGSHSKVGKTIPLDAVSGACTLTSGVCACVRQIHVGRI